MTAAQHAGEILQAWQFREAASLETALDSALASCTASEPLSGLEAERAEVLQSIVAHLRAVDHKEKFTESSRGSAAWNLLSHLSSDLNPKKSGEPTPKILSANILKFGIKRATCFTEVECRPRAYAG